MLAGHFHAGHPAGVEFIFNRLVKLLSGALETGRRARIDNRALRASCVARFQTWGWAWSESVSGWLTESGSIFPPPAEAWRAVCSRQLQVLQACRVKEHVFLSPR